MQISHLDGYDAHCQRTDGSRLLGGSNKKWRSATLLSIVLLSALPEFCAGLSLVHSSGRQELTRRRSLDQRGLTRRRSLFIASKFAATALATTASLVLPGALRPALAKNLPYVATSDISKVGTVDALLPIIKLLDSLQKLQAEIKRSPDVFIQRALDSQLPSSEQSFKEMFDSYSEPVSYKQRFLDQNAFLVYYTRGFDGPGRPSIEEDVNVRQTLQYGYRNEAWVAYEEFLCEIRYSGKHPEEFEEIDALQPLATAIESIEKYLSEATSEAVLEGRRRLDSD
jgi:hypothetical protein